MKNISNKYLFILLAGIALCSYSCNKLLDVKLTGKMTSEDFWKNKEQAIAEIIGCYQGLVDRNGLTGSPYTSATIMPPLESILTWGELRGDLLTTIGKFPSDQIDKEKVHSFNVDPTNVITSYTSIYNIINQVNLVIKRVPEILVVDPSFTQADNDAILGEAYFIRALCYFQLVRAFRDVPYVTDPSETDKQNYEVAKESGTVILANIAADLEHAKTVLPDNYNNINTVYTQCRATKYAAMALLADIYLWMNDYNKCIENCDAIINSRRYSLVPMADFKSSVFTTGNSTESIFELYSNANLQQFNNLYYWFINKYLYIVVNNSYGALFSDPKDARSPSRILFPLTTPAQNTDFVDMNTSFVRKWSTNDSRWIFYRLAEIYLMQAEAYVHRNNGNSGDISIAKNIIYNSTLRRAYYYDPTYTLSDQGFPNKTTWMDQFQTLSDMDNLILDERGRELAHEGKRWYDLVRIASRDNYANKELLMTRILAATSGTDQLFIRARILNPESWYLPLNANELAANSKLVQNPYYR
jgi:hypothetical protein